MSQRALLSRCRRALCFAQGHGFSIAVLLGCTFLVGGVGALEPLVMKEVFDAVGKTPLNTVFALVALIVVLGLFREVFGGFANWLSWKTRLSVQHALLDAAVDRLHSLPIAYHRQNGVGRIMTKLDRGTQGFVSAVSELLFTVLPSLVYLLVAVVIMFGLDFRLALTVLMFVPIPAIIAAIASPEQIARERNLLERWANIYARFNEVLHGITTVKSSCMEQHERSRFIGDVGGANGVVVQGVARDTSVGAVKNLVTVAASAAAIGMGAYLVQAGEITLGTVVAFLGYLHGLFGPVQGLTGTYQSLRKASVSLEAIFDILDHPDPLSDRPGAIELRELRGDIEFRNVDFAYVEGTPVLSKINLSLRAGEMVAIVGKSGSGKSTIASLLQRFYAPTSGEIRIDGNDLGLVTQNSLRKHIGVVHQEPILFDDTIFANITYGCLMSRIRELGTREVSTREMRVQEVETAAMAANAHEFIVRLPQGYDTKVGERGCLLSAGQRQRIAIARAILRDPKILILDEATSALDVDSEMLIQRALAELVRNRTTLVIAHRLSTVRSADRIVVLDDGQIIEEGTHSFLMASEGFYAAFVQKQSGGRLLAA